MPLKQEGKVRTNRLHNFDNALKRWHNAHGARLTLKDYLKGEVDMHIHYVFVVSDLDVREFCAVLKLNKRDGYTPIIDNFSIFDCISANSHAVSNGDRWKEQLVLVHDVKFMEETEAVSVPSESIIERLQTLDHCKCVLPNPTLEFDFSTLKGCSVSKNWEVHCGGVASNPAGILAMAQRPKQVIERRSSVVKAITNDKRPQNDVRLGFDAEMKRKFTGLLINIFDDRVRFAFSGKGGDSLLESIKVFLCPSDFRVESDG